MDEPLFLNTVFSKWFSGGGVFGALQLLPVPWKNEDIALSLDIEYHGNRSGGKIVSPLVRYISNYNEPNGVPLSDSEKATLCNSILSVYGANWSKQWETMQLAYNPIENYSMTEQMSNDETVNQYGKTRTRTDNLTHTKTGTETGKPNLTETQTPNLTNVSENTVHGFNSTAGVPSGSQSQTATGTNTNTRTGTDAVEYNTTDSDTGTQTDNDGGQDTQTRNYKLTRSGNIGVTTSQQMIESERTLWVWNFFRDVVFPDLDRVLTLRIY